MKNILHDKKYAKILKTSTWVGLLPESYIRFKTPSPHIMCCQEKNEKQINNMQKT